MPRTKRQRRKGACDRMVERLAAAYGPDEPANVDALRRRVAFYENRVRFAKSYLASFIRDGVDRTDAGERLKQTLVYQTQLLAQARAALAAADKETATVPAT